MNPDNLFESLQTGFRVTLGATTSLIESLQDSQAREYNISLLKSDLNALVREWGEKGEVTELEARNFVDNVLMQRNAPSSTQATSAPFDNSSVTPPVAPPDVQLELQELTAQIAAIRVELETLRNSGTGV